MRDFDELNDRRNEASELQRKEASRERDDVYKQLKMVMAELDQVRKKKNQRFAYHEIEHQLQTQLELSTMKLQQLETERDEALMKLQSSELQRQKREKEMDVEMTRLQRELQQSQDIVSRTDSRCKTLMV